MRVVRALSLVALVLAGAACAELDPRPGPIRAMEPRPNPGSIATPATSPQERVRRNRWLTRFWEELTPGQRRLVESRMRRARPALAANRREAQGAWDTMGLEQRDTLVFGAPARPSAPATAQEAAPARAGGG